ncbi:UNVERIFIED_CONTAM: hypothetical protein K2H54_074464, partial [Gekko kuhli]
SKYLAGFQEIFKETDSVIKSEVINLVPIMTSHFLADVNVQGKQLLVYVSKFSGVVWLLSHSVPDEPAKYTVQYLSHYFPEQGLTPLIHVENHPSSLSLAQATEVKHPGTAYVTLQLGEKELQNMALGQGTNVSSPYCKATAWRLEKYHRGRATTEKTTSLPKGLLDNSKTNSDGKEKRGKEGSPPRSANFGRKRAESHEGDIRFSRFSHTQDFLPLSLPFVADPKYRQTPERCQRSEPHLKCLGHYRPRLATLSTTKETNKTILLKRCEAGETSHSSSLLNTRQKMPPQTLLCQSESKFFSKRRKSECLNHRPPTQDLSSTERISFHA